ncbi:MAG: hypothetical protein COY68_04620 [Candidatus Levybacteria bacterium CG_4_10_14_0_8_um_filter_35_23]|nr:MAG: hypothetical protein COY68_04620 [Candidatus Levybacteria bacterium CG_4_10_14_0_8_um_filter_35_23]
MRKSLFLQQSGQALISILFITIIGMTIISSAAFLVYGNTQSVSITEQGSYAYYVAESGAEEGLLRLVRNPYYSGTPIGQPFIVGLGSAVIEVDTASGLITSTGTYNNTTRKIQAQTVYNNGIRTITSWKEVW